MLRQQSRLEPVALSLANPVSIGQHATVNQQYKTRDTERRRSHRNLCSRDRSRVYGNCSTTTARFLRVAVTTYFYTHEKGVRGGGVGCGADYMTRQVRDRGEGRNHWAALYTRRTAYIGCCVCVPWAASSLRLAHEGVSESESPTLGALRLIYMYLK